nr:hypothetical protein [Acetobacter persici]
MQGTEKHFVLTACRQPGGQSKNRFRLLIRSEILPPSGSSRSVEKRPNTAIMISKKYNDFSTNIIIGENDEILEKERREVVPDFFCA